MVPFMTLTNRMPSERYIIPMITSTDVIKVVVTWIEATSLTVGTSKIINGVYGQWTFGQGYFTVTSNNYVAEKVTGFDG